jgi:hypothetical protein
MEVRNVCTSCEAAVDRASGNLQYTVSFVCLTSEDAVWTIAPYFTFEEVANLDSEVGV